MATVIVHTPNRRLQGTAGMGIAIGWFASNGYIVSVPLTDAQRYDLVVDDGSRLQKVQVKTTTRRQRNGNYLVMLRTMGGNRSWNGVVKLFDPTEVDILFVVTGDGGTYLIPSPLIKVTTSLTLTSSWDNCKV